jgi:hypothetical protein
VKAAHFASAARLFSKNCVDVKPLQVLRTTVSTAVRETAVSVTAALGSPTGGAGVKRLRGFYKKYARNITFFTKKEGGTFKR